MSGRIRSKLGPVKKRVLDRINEASVLLKDDVDARLIKDVRTKLKANVETLEKISAPLNDVVDENEDEKRLTDVEIEKCSELQMDADEMLGTLGQRLLELEMGDTKISVQNTAMMESEKVKREIEKLKVETEYRRSKMEQLKDGGHVEHRNRPKIKLPSVKLPTFSGKITEWPTFWDSFDSMINTNSDISKIDKFKYLMSCLDGEAKETLVGYRLTESQYDVAVAQLKERYDDVEFIIHNHYEKLTKLPRSSNVTSQLRKSFNVIETQLRSLEALGENVESKQLVSLIKSKLPQQLNLKLEESRNGDWTMLNLRKSIHKFILAREKTEGDDNYSEEFKDEDIGYTTEGLFSKESKIKCIFCEKGHWSDECQRFKTLEERKMKIKGCCFICLSKNHYFRRCMSDKPCFYCKRRKNHHSSLCPEKFGVVSASENNLANDTRFERKETEDDTNLVSNETLNMAQEVLMKTAKVRIRNPDSGKTTSAMILLDTGAKHTYITTEKAKAIGVTGGFPTMVKINTFGTEEQSVMETRKTSFMIQESDGAYKRMNARICDTVTGIIKKKKISMEKYGKLCKDLMMADDLPDRDRCTKIDILIGNDYYDEIVKAEKIKLDSGMYLVNSSLGWMFSGRTDGNEEPEEEESIMIAEDIDIERTFWDMETVGINSATSDLVNKDAIGTFNESVTMVNNRYEVSWPWKISKYELPSNLKLAESRLKSLLLKLNKEKDVMLKYDDIIKKQLKDEIIEVADSTNEYVSKNSVVTHYLPHHAVTSINGKETKVRIVMEGCAKTHPSKRSLNDCLERGPNLVSNLCGMLMRFRLHRVALIADIEKAYLQLQLNESDRDVIRFLWLKDIDKPFSNDNLLVLRFCRVIWGVVSAAFLLAMTVLYHLKNYDNEVAQKISRDMYVDNLITGVSSNDEAVLFYRQTKDIFNDASMNMCKWNCNSEEVMKEIGEDDKCDEKVTKLLGLVWFRDSDEIGLTKVESDSLKKVTKRSVLQFISSRFDPVGLVSPALLRAKLFLQELWRLKVKWDENLSNEKLKEWNKIVDDVKEVGNLKVNRFVGIVDNRKQTSYSLITFSDASKLAYAAAVYIKMDNGESTNISLMFSKHRLAPLKQQLTIPRLELLGVLVGCRVSKFVGDQLGIPESAQKVFTDSECVLEWCKSSKDLKKFVEDKVKEIRNFNISIGYVRSEENPADIATRGMGIDKLRGNKLWWNGPKWLMFEESQWPHGTYDLNDEIRAAVMNEEGGAKIMYETGLLSNLNVAGEVETPFGINEIRFSSFQRLIRTTAWCHRFLWNIQNRESKQVGVLTVDELKKAEILWVKSVQEEHFNEIQISVEENTKNQLKLQLGVYKDDKGVLRCAGRFLNMPVHPVLIPKNSHFTKLYVVNCHRKLLHSGAKQTLAEVRREYWIPQGRSVVQRILRSCLICIHWEGGPFKTPVYAPFPGYVLSDEKPPFTFVGIDYMGPLFVKDGGDSRKNWICLFTCLNVRAVHLDIVEDMTTEGFLSCLRRFIARRGTPSLIISDNGSQLKLGYAVIGKMWDSIVNSSDVQSYVADEAIRWKFITEYAPWKGGFYERLIGLTKRSLRKALSRVKVGRTELMTLITEVEAVINSRPLTYVENDIESAPTVLTPAHFLSLNHKTGIPDIELCFTPAQDQRSELLGMWKKGQLHLKTFWNTWLTEYLPLLRERQRIQMKSTKGEIDRNPKINEIVLIKEENLPRGRWKLAKVVNLIEGEVDGVERAAVLMLASGIIVRRPFKLLYPLECGDRNDESSMKDKSDENEERVQNRIRGSDNDNQRIEETRNTRPIRKAANLARLQIRMQCNGE